MERLTGHLVKRHGITKVRLTGGEPTLRPDLLDIVRRLARLPGLRELTLTTNGLRLAQLASELAAAGLRRVNVSLDSLNPVTFRRISGVNGLPLVLEGIERAMEAGLTPIKVNTVLVRGENEDDIPALVRFAAKCGAHLRFIELMPMGSLARHWNDRFVPADFVVKRVQELTDRWEPLPATGGSARMYSVRLRAGGSATIGFIAPVTCTFCSTCDRLRIADDGTLYPCLMDHPAGNLLEAVRPNWNSEALDATLRRALLHKARFHPAQGAAVMTRLGG